MRLKITALLLCVLTVLGCETKQGTGTLVGTGGGAVLGAIIGKIAGNTAVGAAIGGVVGAGTGAIIGRHMDKVAEQAKAQVENAKVEQVTDKNGLSAVKVTFDSGILFATNKSDLNATSKNELAKFSNVLKQNTDCYLWTHRLYRQRRNQYPSFQFSCTECGHLSETVRNQRCPDEEG